MKNFCAVLTLILATGLAFAPLAAKSDEPKKHELKAEFVSGNPDAKTVTVKLADGTEHTFPVEGKALEALNSFKAGDKVTITCRDDEKGQHQAIVEIRKG